MAEQENIVIPGGALAAAMPVVQAPVVEAPPPAADTAAASLPDWRQPLVDNLGKDYGADKAKAFLDRFDGVEALAKKAIEQERLIAQGAHKKPQVPGADASPEVLAAYREANGIPESPDKYDITMDDGTVFGEDDQPSIDFIRNVSHKIGLTNDQVKAIAADYAAFDEAQHAARDEADKVFHAEQSAEITELWGDKLKENASRIATVFANIDGGKEIFDSIMSGRDADGNMIANNAKILNVLHQLAIRELPNHTIVDTPGFSGKGISARLEELKGMMNSSKWTNERADEYATLIAKRDKIPLK